jgi:cysteine synthase
MIYSDVFQMIGHTPCVRVRSSATNGALIYLKMEGANPTGSIKDRACAFILKTALDDGSLRSGMRLLDASSGNFACALAFYGRILGYPASVAVSSKLTAAKRDFLTYLDAEIFSVGDFTIQGNEFCRRLTSNHPGRYFFLDQLHNWGNPRAHMETTGPEILEQVPELAVVVGSLGSGGTMAGIAAFLKKTAPHVQIVVVECASGNRMPGTGTFVDGDYVTPFIRDAHERKHFDHTIRVTESDAAAMTRSLMDDGLFCGLQTGGVIHAAMECVRDTSRPVVVLSGDTGWKNLDKLLTVHDARECDGYHA